MVPANISSISTIPKIVIDNTTAAVFLTDPFTPFKTRIACKLSTCSLHLSFYDYRPSIALNTLFIILFSLTGFMHLVQLLFWPRKFFTYCITVGCLISIVGYISRLLGNENPFSLGPYFVQFIGLTIAPAFFSASIYSTLGSIMQVLGPQFSRLRPEVYTKVFVASDVASLILQGAGGLATLGLLLGGEDAQSDIGINIMLVGLGWQIFSLIVFVFLAGEWAWRLGKAKGRRVFEGKGQGKLMVFVVFFCVAIFCVFARCCYRCAELSGGLYGHLLRDEVVFTFLESMLISVGVFALNLGHPGMLPAPTSLAMDLEGSALRDLEKPLPDLKVTPPSGSQSANSSQEDLIIQSDIRPGPGKRSSRYLAQKRFSRLSPNYFARRKVPTQADAWPLRSRSRNAQRLSATSLTDIYTMYHGKDSGWSDDEKAITRHNKGGWPGDQMQVVHIQDKGVGGSGLTISLSYPGQQRPNFV